MSKPVSITGLPSVGRPAGHCSQTTTIRRRRRKPSHLALPYIPAVEPPSMRCMHARPALPCLSFPVSKRATVGPSHQALPSLPCLPRWLCLLARFPPGVTDNAACGRLAACIAEPGQTARRPSRRRHVWCGPVGVYPASGRSGVRFCVATSGGGFCEG